jgi:hypothetical protein
MVNEAVMPEPRSAERPDSAILGPSAETSQVARQKERSTQITKRHDSDVARIVLAAALGISVEFYCSSYSTVNHLIFSAR